jgi:PASTA domain
VDDEFGLLPDQDDPTPPRRPAGALVAGLAVVALLAVAAVFWMVTSVAGRGVKITAAGTPAPATSAPTTTRPTTPPTTPPATTTPAPTTTSAPRRTPGPTVIPPLTIRPAPTTPRPVPTATKPAPRPTPSAPVGRLVRVPDVTGLRVQQAGTVLRAAGLKVQVVGGVLDPDRDERRVVFQRPTGGQVVLAGSTVILVTDGT